MFAFGARSQAQITSLQPDFKALLEASIAVSPNDFGIPVLGGARTADQQHELWQQGRNGNPGKVVTQKDGYNDKSEHQIKDDEFGYAVDVVPYISKAFTWNWEFIFPIIKTIGTEARKRGISLRWGGVWDRKLEDLNLDNLEAEVHAYTVRHPGPDHIDGPHLEYHGKIATKVKK